jgi:ribonuclease Z
MRPTLLPRLVNGPFADPALFVRFLFENRAILFDLGEIHALSTRNILKLSHVFVSHTHMDHFVGFDRLLRLMLGRDKEIALYGPEGFFQNIEGKLAAYQWNLVNNFANSFKLHVVEVSAGATRTKTYACHNRFSALESAVAHPFSGLLVEEPAFTVSAVILDHRIPCLGLSLQEQFHINIKKDALQRMRLTPGPWLNRFKQALFSKLSPHAEVAVPSENGEKRFPLGELADHIAVISPGQKITYIADAAYHSENIDKIVSLAENSDQLFIEAAFLEKHAAIAAEKYHLTARQAGELAALSHAKRFTPFHFSPRYTDEPEAIPQEAMHAFGAAGGSSWATTR